MIPRMKWTARDNNIGGKKIISEEQVHVKGTPVCLGGHLKPIFFLYCLSFLTSTFHVSENFLKCFYQIQSSDSLCRSDYSGKKFSTVKMNIESQNQRMAWVERAPRLIRFQALCHRQSHQPPDLVLEQVSQGPIQPELEHLEG